MREQWIRGSPLSHTSWRAYAQGYDGSRSIDCRIAPALHLGLSIRVSCLCSNCYAGQRCTLCFSVVYNYFWTAFVVEKRPVFTMIDDNLQHLVEFSIVATLSEQAVWLPCVHVLLPVMSLLIVYEYRV